MRIDSSLPAVSLGLVPARRAVMPVAPAPAASGPQREAPPRPEGLPTARGHASLWPTAVPDARATGLRVWQAIEAYTTVRDGDRRDYLRRVMGLETVA
jgi:hypothetical protein